MQHAKSIGADNATINMGFDGRLSSPNLVENLVKGALATGCNVNNIGLVPTPTLYLQISF